MTTAGYSGTPLAKKLGMKDGFKVAFHQLPDHYFDLFIEMPDLEVSEEIKAESLDFGHLFFTRYEDLKSETESFKQALKKTGMIWISWPKGSSKIETDLNGNIVREYGLSIGLVDVKVAAIDSDWSGLKFMYRVKDR